MIKTEELKPTLYSQSSYYRKAYISKIYDSKEELKSIMLFSYKTHIATIYYNTVYPRFKMCLSLEIYENIKLLTSTTRKHLRDFYYQFGNAERKRVVIGGHYITTKELKYLIKND